MNSKKMQECMKFGSVGIILVLLLLMPMMQVKHPLLSDKPDNDVYNTYNEKLATHGNNDLTQLPYLQNISYVGDWVNNNLTDENTYPVSPSESLNPLFFGDSDREGAITNQNHYFEDFAVMFDGLLQLANPEMTNSELIEYYNRLNDYNFENISGDGGYYTFLNDDLSENSSVIELNGNLQPILSFSDWILENQSANNLAADIMAEQWSSMKSLFWDTDALFAHSSADQNRYILDQFVAALSGMYMYQASINGYADDGITTADSIMEEIMNSGKEIYNTNKDFFIEEMNSNFVTAIDSKPYLSTNAYGIWALIEWALSDPDVTTGEYDQRVDAAEAVYSTLRTNFWNETYNIYIPVTDVEFNYELTDPTSSLEDNAIMLLATLKLFQITKNISYFDDLYEHYLGIEERFRDQQYGSYYTNFNVFSEAVNDTKDLTAHAYLLRTYSELDKIGQLTSSSISLNDSSAIYNEVATINISSSFNLDYNMGFESYSTPIKNADARVIIRYPNNTILEDNIVQTNALGEANYIYDLPTDLEIGEYSIAVRLNYTGLETSYLTSSFSIDSGIIVQDIIMEDTDVKAGASTDVKLVVNSTYDTDVTFDLYIHGDRIQNQTLEEPVLLDANAITNVTFNVQTLVDAEFGLTTFYMDFTNDSQEFESYSQDITILSPIKVVEIRQNSRVYKNQDMVLELTIENEAEVSAPIKISITGDDLNELNFETTLQPETTKTIFLNVSLNQNIEVGYMDFSFDIIRTSDDQVVYTRSFTTYVYHPIEILNVNVPNSLPHGQEAKVLVDVNNHLSNTSTIFVEIMQNGEVITSKEYSLLSGESIIGLEFSKNINPYKLGSENFDIQIKDSQNQVIYKESFNLDYNLSGWSFLLGYLLPIIIPVIGMVVIKHMSMENKKRLG